MQHGIKKSDRRTEKSKAALSQALIELMMEVGFEQLSVADVAERANVGRSTFYAHFADKEALLRESLQGLRAHLIHVESARGARDVHPALAFSLPMLQHVSEVRKVFHSVVTRRGVPLDLLQQMLTDLLTERITTAGRCVPDGAPDHAKPPSLVVQHIIGSFLAVCTWWMTERPDLNPTEVDDAFRALVEPGLGTRPA
jgi:AcrR family transcriptional regulator